MFMKESKLLNVLFLGGAKRVSLAERFLKSAKKMGINLNIFSYEIDKNVPISNFAQIIIGLRWNDKEILDHLLQVISKYNINMILPFVDPAVLILAKLKTKIKDVFIPVSSEKVCNTFFDKIEANNWFIKNGLLTPEETDKLPLIAKPRKGSASKGIIIIQSKEELKYFDDNFNQKEYLIQKFIKGEEYSVDCYVSVKGEILSIVPRRRLEVTSGEVTKSVTVRDNEIISLTFKILKTESFIGPITIQFIRELESRRLFVIEINTRFGGGVILSIEAGVDIFSILLKDYFDISNKPVYDWKENLLMTRAYREFFQNANNY